MILKEGDPVLFKVGGYYRIGTFDKYESANTGACCAWVICFDDTVGRRRLLYNLDDLKAFDLCRVEAPKVPTKFELAQEQFEEWAEKNNYLLQKAGSGKYAADSTNFAWDGFRAAKGITDER